MSDNLFNLEDRGAVFSRCRKYRFMLWRFWDNSKPKVMFIGLNPSTANESENDNTIKKVIKIARNNGFGGVYMLNCFPYISTQPGDMVDFYETDFHDYEDMENMHTLLDVSKRCSEVVFAWGNFKVAIERGKAIAGYFPIAKALHINRNGSPKHPLYCKDDQKLIPFLRKEPSA